jgi:hypothetical protein
MLPLRRLTALQVPQTRLAAFKGLSNTSFAVQLARSRILRLDGNLLVRRRCGARAHRPSRSRSIWTRVYRGRLSNPATASFRAAVCCRAEQEGLPMPSSGSRRQPSPKVQALADEITGLTLLEVSDLTTLLKVRVTVCQHCARLCAE